MTNHLNRSPKAASELEDAIGEGYSVFDDEMDNLSGVTDCPNGCVVEPDGYCPHNYESAARTLGVI